MKRILYLVICMTLSVSISTYGQSKKKKDQKATTYSLVSEIEQLSKFELLPQYRQGIVEQISSYDTTGGNDDGFSGKYSFLRKEGDNLILQDLKGPGVINRIWTPTPTNDTIQFYIDGETVPRISIRFIDLFSGKVFPFINPVCGNEVGGYYCYIPIQYNKSCKIVYKGKMIQFHQIQHRPYPAGTVVESFKMNWSDNEKQELEQACKLWSMQTNPVKNLQESGVAVLEDTKTFFLSPGESIPFFNLSQGGRIVGIEVNCGSALAGANKDILLQAKWDNDQHFAINCPAADFFGYAYGKPAMRSVFSGNSSKNINYCYIPMPFEKNGILRFTYKNRSGVTQAKIEINTTVYYTINAQKPETEGKLYTTWRREIKPKDGEPYLMEKLNDKGHYIGTIHLAQGLKPGMTLFFEGDDSISVDGKMRMHGTGSEDYYNGGWYAVLDRWDRGVSLPIHGSLDYSLQMGRTGAYRFYLTDKMSFENDFLLTMEHGPEGNKFPVDYTSIAFHYGSKPSMSKVEPTEELCTVYYPNEHVFFPQQMQLTLGGDINLESKGRLIGTTTGEGTIRIMLNDIPEGRYKLGLSYFQIPEGAEFSVWNRQKMISDWKSTVGEKEKFLEKQEIGEFNLTPHTNSISIRFRKVNNNNKFHFEHLFLEKIGE